MATKLRIGVFAVAIAFGSAGCYRGPGTQDPNWPSDLVLPVGILTDSQSGIFAANVPWANGCCWLAPSATFRVPIQAGATILSVRVAVPDLPAPDASRQGVTISVNGGLAKTFSNLGVGVKDLTVPVRPSAQANIATVSMNMAESFVPPGDGRNLSLFLVRVTSR
jgi:hypothetical protein